ncbi:OpgC domain-containing protein [Methylibium sp.]|uniref:OpgC domain-containing protein n=1 Tax=Methylibium sp. TaxID=2067992 RepID=UPI003D0DDA13
MNRRLWEIDALRGLMLVLMTVTHLPTRYSDPLGQPFGYVSAAEGFVLLSAFMAGMVYTARERRDGEAVMREAFLKRALKIYCCQAALLLFLFTVIALIGVVAKQDAITNMISFYIEQPLTAFFSGLLLVYSPPLLDILPLYIVFMLVSPVLLLHGLQHGWLGILALSVLLWLLAQFDLGRAVYDGVVALTGLPVPFPQTGAFEIFGWQFLWVMGLWMGSVRAATREPAPVVFPPWLVRAAVVLGVTGLVWRHAVGQLPFPGHDALNLMFDKWHLGPLRLINFFALLTLAMHFGPRIAARLPRLTVLETLGAASLPVFCAHLVLALLLLALAGDVSQQRPLWLDTLILAGSYAILYAVAWISGQLDLRTAAMRERLKRQTAQTLSAVARARAGGRR